ncbi:hypothetical protein GJ744_002441 [Endocarpon pusillum]|uniref:Uncharacterized protein n=1 Tax=Endocarpon pusillum TaxID=364733 RepID=A0A8H7ABY4_9EURO|nr:hypothetical protein GJ744_002441 [Endocarpon pusillum]
MIYYPSPQPSIKPSATGAAFPTSLCIPFSLTLLQGPKASMKVTSPVLTLVPTYRFIRGRGLDQRVLYCGKGI